ncbi:MAG: tail fiber domain-containing protein [Bacteroidales bacterium]|nr:tail fiber domain-containing protein [Bacteroidales bacterium]
MKFYLSLILLAALCALQTAFAQSPQNLNYQAVVRGEGGNIISNADVAVKITILQGSLPGSEVCTEEFFVTTNDYGLVNLKLGSNNPAAFEVIDWSAGPYFIKTEIDDDGDAVYTETGTSQMLSVPYALHSLTADKTLGDSLWKKSGSHIYYSEGRIGLGTSKPEGDIHIADTVGTTDTYTYYETDNVKSRVGADEASGAMWLQSGSEWDRGSITDINFSGIFGQPRQMIIKANGNVGIGTMAPERRLHVDDGSDVNGSYGGYIQTGPGTSYNVGFDNNEIQARNNGNPSHLMLQAEGGDLNIHTGLSDPYRRFIIKDDGKVGMGTSAPVSRLDLRTPSAWSDETPLFEIKNNDGVPVFAVYNNGVRVLVEDDPAKKGPKGGFAIGGFDPTKAGSTVDFMRITPDSIRFNINNSASKGPKGGFAIGGFDRTKGEVNEDFMYVTPQSSDAGMYNTFLGYKSGEYNTGQHNTFLGSYSGRNSEGSWNNFIGKDAGRNNTTGGSNCFFGHSAGLNNTTGYGNVFFGNASGKNNTYGYNNIYIGTNAGEWQTTGDYNVIIGAQWSGSAKPDRNRNIRIGARAGIDDTGSYRLFIDGSGSGTTYASSLIYGYYGSGSHKLRINGNLEYTGSLSDVSDRILKTDLVIIDNVLEKINSVNGYFFNWSSEAKSKLEVENKKQLGVIAQEVEQVFPELVSENDEGYMMVDYVKLTPILLQAIKEQQATIEELESRVSQSEDLKTRISILEQMVMEMAGEE